MCAPLARGSRLLCATMLFQCRVICCVENLHQDRQIAHGQNPPEHLEEKSTQVDVWCRKRHGFCLRRLCCLFKFFPNFFGVSLGETSLQEQGSAHRINWAHRSSRTPFPLIVVVFVVPVSSASFTFSCRAHPVPARAPAHGRGPAKSQLFGPSRVMQKAGPQRNTSSMGRK